MKNKIGLFPLRLGAVASALIVSLAITGCRSGNNSSMATQPAPAATVQAPSAAASPMASVQNADFRTMKGPIRIDAGSSSLVTDSNGNVWLPDQGFQGGDTAERANDLKIAGTDIPEIYRTEHYGMSSFSCKLPNGVYAVKLHFAETFDGVTGSGQRVFSFDVNRQGMNGFDVFKQAGGADRAFVQTLHTVVTDGQLTITFTSNVQNPEINGIEIIPGR